MQERFVAGSLAGATAQTIIYPMEVRRRDPDGGPVSLHGVISPGIITLPLLDSATPRKAEKYSLYF